MENEAHILHTPSSMSRLPVGWIWGRLDCLCEGVFDCPHSTPVLEKVGPYIARSQDIRSGVFRREEAGHVSEVTYRERVARAVPRTGDLLYSREGTYFGIAAEVPPGDSICLGQRMVLLRPNPAQVHFRFLRYWLNSPAMATHAAGQRDGSVAERLNLPTIQALPVPIPPLPEQRAIAQILGTLDDKIELSRRMNETLEAMARALFKLWFVDFDPVHSVHLVHSVHAPGLPRPLANLFPNSFQESALGRKPTGWKPCPWGDLVTLEYGKSLSGYQGDEGAFPVYGTNGRIGTHSQQLCPHPGIIIGRKGAYRGVHYCGSPFFVIDTAFYVEPRVPIELRWAYYEILRQDINGMDSGSAIPSTSREDFYALPVVAPPLEVQRAFTKLLEPVWLRQQQCEQESRTLAALRDTLLPKLVSGELRVQDAERFIEETP